MKLCKLKSLKSRYSTSNCHLWFNCAKTHIVSSFGFLFDLWMFLFVWQPLVLHRRRYRRCVCVCVGASRFCNCNQTITSAIFLENFVGSGAETHYATKSLNEWTVSYFKIIHLNINCVCLLHLLSCYWQIRQNYTRLNVCACVLRAFSAVFFSLCFFFRHHCSVNCLLFSSGNMHSKLNFNSMSIGALLL